MALGENVGPSYYCCYCHYEDHYVAAAADYGGDDDDVVAHSINPKIAKVFYICEVLNEILYKTITMKMVDGNSGSGMQGYEYC